MYDNTEGFMKLHISGQTTFQDIHTITHFYTVYAWGKNMFYVVNFL